MKPFEWLNNSLSFSPSDSYQMRQDIVPSCVPSRRNYDMPLMPLRPKACQNPIYSSPCSD